MPNSLPLIAVFGATGYVGGRLIPKLLDEGYRIRAVSRSIEKLKNRSYAYHPNIQLYAADVNDAASISQALVDVDIAYYLIHSMGVKGDFAQVDRQSAKNFVQAANQSQLSRIIYLGGLGKITKDLSHHLQSRQEVGKILGSSKIPLTYLRAAVIIGAGSASFEVLRYLVDRVPVMITPKWVRTKNQPIAISDVLDYLSGVLKKEETIGKTFDIGGPEIMTYKELMDTYIQEAHLSKRWIIPVPVLTPYLSSLWVGLISPVPAAIARPLIEGLKNEVICKEGHLKEILGIKPTPIREAMRLAIELTNEGYIETSWTDAGAIPPEMPQEHDPEWSGGTLLSDTQQTTINASIEEAWSSVTHIGGKHGWYYANWLWKIRGFIDRILGGVGLRRGRKDAFEIFAGDAIDFWRVKVADAPKKLLLVAEMKVPGIASLEFILKEIDLNTTHVTQTARFYPKGLMGILYWKSMWLFHRYIFKGMLKGIKDQTRMLSRRAVNIPAQIDAYGKIISCHIVDISERGCRIQIEEEPPFPLVSSMPVYLMIAGQKPFKTAITYLKNDDTNTFIGLRFSRPQIINF